MSETIRVEQTDRSMTTWKISSMLFALNNSEKLIEDVIPTVTYEFDIKVKEGKRAAVIGMLGQIEALSVKEQEVRETTTRQ